MIKFFVIGILSCLVLNSAYSQNINDIMSEKSFKAGMIRFYNREYEAAAQLFTKALSYEPAHFKARYFLGQAFLNSGYAKNAADEWENLIKLGIGNFQIKQKLNDLYFRLSIDKSYDYTSPYIFTSILDGSTNIMHRIDRPSFLLYDEATDAILISSTGTHYVVEIDGAGHIIREFGRNFIDTVKLKMPMGLALFNNKLYVSDYKSDCINVFQRDGKFLNKLGTHGFSSSNIAGPMGLAITPDEYLFVVDNGNDRIQKFDLKGEWIQSIGQDELKRPTDIVSVDNTLYVSDTFNKRIVAYDTFGNMLETIGDEVLSEPRGLTFKDGKLYITDAQNGLYIYNIDNKTLEKFGLDNDRMKMPFDVCLDSKNILYESDFNSQNVAIYAPLQLQYANLGVQTSQIWMGSYPKNLIHFRVWDKTGKPVQNLKEDNILITEEGTEVPFVRLGPTYEYRKNMYVKVIVDKSTSMKEFEPELMDTLTSFLQKCTGSDWIDFKTIGATIESTGKMNASVLRPLDFLKKNPYYAEYPASVDHVIYESTQELLNINRNKAILFITTGEVGESSFSDYEPDLLLTYARQNAIPIYIINLSDKNREIYQRIAEDTFGKYYTLRDIKSILDLYNEMKNAPPLEYIASYDGLNLKGLRNFWVNVHIRVKYKDLVGVDDTGYYVPEFFLPTGLFGNKESLKIDEEKPKHTTTGGGHGGASGGHGGGEAKKPSGGHGGGGAKTTTHGGTTKKAGTEKKPEEKKKTEKKPAAKGGHH